MRIILFLLYSKIVIANIYFESVVSNNNPKYSNFTALVFNKKYLNATATTFIDLAKMTVPNNFA